MLNKKSSWYLGVHVAERVLENEFKGIQRMANGNPGYDYICGKGFKIDVKSACGICTSIGHDFVSWMFNINGNQKADYFLCLAFGNRSELIPKHLWLIPANLVNLKRALIINGNKEGLANWEKYERPIDRAERECALIRLEGA